MDALCGAYLRKKETKRKRRMTDLRKRKREESESLKLYFPSTRVDFKGISFCDHDNLHPIDVRYPRRKIRKCLEVVKGKKLEMDVASLLSNSRRRNYLVRNNGVKESVDSCIAGKYLLICCFKVPLPHSHEAADRCRAMIAAYNGLRQKNENFEMVMVAKMAAVGGGDEEAAFNRFFEAFHCLAVPFCDAESRDFICMSLGLTDPSTHCAALVLDPDQVVLQTDGDCFYTYGASGFPYTSERLDAVDAQDTETSDGMDCFLNNGQLLPHPVSLSQLLDSDSDILLSRFRGEDTISASELTKKKCVMLYICLDGWLMKELEDIRVRETSKGRECEVVVIPVPFLWDPGSFANALKLALEKKKLSSWWVMPGLVGDEEATRRLWRLAGQTQEDAVFFMSDGGRAVELEWLLLVENHSGFEYPFTRISLAIDLLNHLRSVKLDPDFNGTNVLLYLDCCKNVCQGNGRLYKELLGRSSEISKEDSKVVFASVNCNCGIQHQQHPWWLVYPGGRGAEIVEKLFPDTQSQSWPALVAFGKDGNILSRHDARHLGEASLFADNLLEEIMDEYEYLAYRENIN